MKRFSATLRLIAWEVTRRCNLACIHCRADAKSEGGVGELTTEEAKKFLLEVSKLGRPVLILTGGEPLLRGDIFDLADYGNSLGLKVVMATNGTLVDRSVAREIKKVGIQRVSVSLDGADENSHDTVRGMRGAFNGALRGIRMLVRENVEFQINTTVTENNVHQLRDIHKLAVLLGAAAHHVFFLVPVGRGKGLVEKGLKSEEYEEVLENFYEISIRSSIPVKATCAPQFYRIARQKCENVKGVNRKTEVRGLATETRGCLAGISFCFVSHAGHVQPCGYLEIDCGQIREEGFTRIWESCEVFEKLRDLSNLRGKCGRCEFRVVCGGCRARAYESSGDFLDEEPLCLYDPHGFGK
ncbi:MAG: heme b synthase [Syntrophales bacterium]|nr:heme b synthase [Syntrophales bacterium]